MIQKTRGIVLRHVKYGETSLIISMLTEAFGLQSYIVNGVRSDKKNAVKASLYQPGSMLELEAYHQEQRGLNRIKEAARSIIHHNILSDVKKNCIALFMMELLYKCLKHPERNDDLFSFCQNSLQSLNEAYEQELSHLPLRFALELPAFLGFGIGMPRSTRAETAEVFFDMTEGCFHETEPEHQHYISGMDCRYIMRIIQNEEKKETGGNMNALGKFITFYSLHIPDFSPPRTLPFLIDMLS